MITDNNGPCTCARCHADLTGIPQTGPWQGSCPVCAKLAERLPEIVGALTREVREELLPERTFEPSPELLNLQRNQVSDADRIRLHGMRVRWS